MKQSVSILILAYNEEKNLENVVDLCDKIAKELFKDYELLIYNDGSNDHTREIAEQLAKNNPKIRVFNSKKNMGQGYAYKQGIQMALKKYVIWVAGDNDASAESIKRVLSHTGEADIIISYIQNINIRPLYRQVIVSCNAEWMSISTVFFLKGMSSQDPYTLLSRKQIVLNPKCWLKN